METVVNEILDYLIKFIDEDVYVYSADSTDVVIGQCTQIKLDHTNSDHVILEVIDAKSESHVYDIWEYDYKTCSWYDGLRKQTYHIKFA